MEKIVLIDLAERQVPFASSRETGQSSPRCRCQPSGGRMKLLHTAAVLALIASLALAQNTVTLTSNLPRAQNSGAGVPGLAGNKNGPAAGSHGQTASSDQTNQATRLQDSSGIPGKPGGKSGPAVMPPSRSAGSP
jgi:hypothetical protein